MNSIAPPIDLRALQVFVTVCETASMTEAARVLGISQSAISQCIKVLEREHGDVLFDRQMRPLRPNAAGRVLLDRARPLLAHARDVALSVRAATKTSLSLLRIGCVDSFAATIGPALVEQLVGTAENLRMWSGLTPMVSEQLVNRELDLAICTESTVDPERVTQQLLFSERFVAVVPLSHAGAPFVEVARSIPLIRYSRRQMTAQQAERFIRHIGIDAPPMYEFDATDPLLSLVASGRGCALTTPLCLLQARHHLPNVALAPLPESPLAKRHFFLLRRNGEWDDIAKLLADCAIRTLRNEVEPTLRKAMPALPLELFN